MQINVVKLGKSNLAVQRLPESQEDPVAAAVDHLIVIDISGSMYSDLPTLRLQLKNKLATLVQEKDTVTLIWFSGRGQCGVLVEQLEIRSLRDLTEVHAAIDRYLQPQGLTGFKEPLQEVLAVIDRISTKRPDSLFSLFFMTDGYDNQWSDKDILEVCQRLEPRLSNAVIVEYGWDCNRELLSKMAETLGGKLIFSQDLQAYQVTFEDEISGSARAKKVPVKLQLPVSLGYAFGFVNDAVCSFVPDATNTVLVPEGVTEVAYFTTVEGRAYDLHSDRSALVWASLVPLSQRMNPNAIFEVLSGLGDVALVNIFSNCFSKEDYILFQSVCRERALLPETRYSEGYDPHAVPKEDAYTVLDLLSDLSAFEDNLFYPHHEAFSYERIGAASAQSEEGATYRYADPDAGYPINGLVWNEGRPNVSVRVRMPVVVSLPAGRPAALPAEIESFVYRNYTVVRDGIVHTRKLPVSLNVQTFQKLKSNGLLENEAWAPGKVFVLEFPRLPVINRAMVKGLTAKETFAKVLQLAVLKGAQKVLNDLRDRVAPKVSAQFLAQYGQEATDYLASVGVTEFNGFNPAGGSVKSGDVYMAKEFKIAVKGLSSLPKVADVEKALAASKKLKASEFVMADTVKRVKAFMASDIVKEAADPQALLVTWAESESEAVVKKARVLTQELARSKFSVVVGHAWFSDVPSLDDATLEVELPGYGNIAVTASLKDIQVEK